MTVPASKVLANKRYRAKTYDTIGFDVRKGKREEYKAAAAELGLSLAAFLTNAADEYALNHTGKDPSSSIVPADNTAEKNPLSAEQKKFVDEFSKLPVDAQKSLLKFLHAVNEKNQP